MTKRTKKRSPKTNVKLPDLEQSKTAVLNSLTAMSSRRSYDHAIRDFIEWYCSEPRLGSDGTLHRRSISDSPPSADWRTRRPTADFLARTSRLAFAV